MKKIIIACVEGFSASVRPDSSTLSEPFKKTMAQFEGEAELIFKEFHSSEIGVIGKIENHMLSQPADEVAGLYMVGKSLGGVKMFRAYKRIVHRFGGYPRVSVVFVDPHSPFPTFFGPYRKIKISSKPSNTKILNVYQREKYPRGAFVTRADESTCLGSGTDHWNIIESATAIRMFGEGFTWILGD